MRRYFTVPGQPQGKGRPRIAIHGGRAHGYTPSKTVSYEALIMGSYLTAYANAEPFRNAVELKIRAVYGIPKSWPLKRKQEALAELIPVTVKPDFDNVLKVVADALNGVAYNDDKQITFAQVEKVYGITPHLEIELQEFERPGIE